MEESINYFFIQLFKIEIIIFHFYSGLSLYFLLVASHDQSKTVHFLHDRLRLELAPARAAPAATMSIEHPLLPSKTVQSNSNPPWTWLTRVFNQFRSVRIDPRRFHSINSNCARDIWISKTACSRKTGFETETAAAAAQNWAQKKVLKQFL